MPLSVHQKSCIVAIIDKLSSDAYRSGYFSIPPLSSLAEDEKDLYTSQIPLDKHRDLLQIKHNIEANVYATIDAFADDVELLFNNAILFCKDRYKVVCQAAMHLLKTFRKLLSELANDAAKSTKSSSSSSSRGVASLSDKNSGKNSSKSSNNNAIHVDIPVSQASKGKKSRKKVKTADVNVSIPDYAIKCEKLLSALISDSSAALLLEPVNAAAFPDYASRIVDPIDFATIRSKLSTGSYHDHNHFAFDVRLTFANFYRYNYHAAVNVVRLRKDVTKVWLSFEKAWSALEKSETDAAVSVGNQCSTFTSTFFNPKSLVAAMEAVFKLPSSNKLPNNYCSQWFINPIRTYFADDAAYSEYSSIVSHPLELGSILSSLIVGAYDSLAVLTKDMALLTSNCEKYWKTLAQRAGVAVSFEQVYMDDAKSIESAFIDVFEAEERKRVTAVPAPPMIKAGGVSQSTKSKGDSKSATSSTSVTANAAVANASSKAGVSQPMLKTKSKGDSKSTNSSASALATAGKSLLVLNRSIAAKPMSEGFRNPKGSKFMKECLRYCMTEVKKHTIPIDGMVVSTYLPFYKAVDPALFPDYATVITNPMNLMLMDNKCIDGKYVTLDEIIDDVILIRGNAHTYNIGATGKPIRAMADALYAYFIYSMRKKVTDFSIQEPIVCMQMMSHRLEELLNEADPPAVLQFLAIEDALVLKKKEAQQARILAAAAAATTASDAAYSSVYYDDQLYEDSAVYEMEEATPVYEVEEATPVATVSTTGTVASYEDSQLTGWELDAYNIWCLVLRHAYVDLSKPVHINDLGFNFSVPVCDMMPAIAEAYLSVIKDPMDLSTLYQKLLDRFITCPIDFYTKLIVIFQNAIDYNGTIEVEAAAKLVTRCEYMKQYCFWVCLEMFPVDTGVEYNSSCILNKEHRTQNRVDREKIVVAGNIGSQKEYNDCLKLLKELERCKLKEERVKVSYFSDISLTLAALSDYAVFVRKPMDLRTIKSRLEGTTQAALEGVAPVRYTKFGEFISDLRLTFSNAIAYNGAHLSSDNTGISRKIYDAALEFQDKLENNLFPNFTLNIADKLCRAQIVSAEEDKKMQALLRMQEELEQEKRLFHDMEMERLKKEDELFARDIDNELKKKETSKQLKANQIAKQRLALGFFDEIADEDSDEEVVALANEIISKARSQGIRGLVNSMDDIETVEAPHTITGYGGSTHATYVPARLLKLSGVKSNVSKRAYARWKTDHYCDNDPIGVDDGSTIGADRDDNDENTTNKIQKINSDSFRSTANTRTAGCWTVLSVEEKQTVAADDAKPMKVAFSFLNKK